MIHYRRTMNASVQMLGEIHALKRCKSGLTNKGTLTFQWGVDEDVALLSKASGARPSIKISDSAGALASPGSIRERMRLLKKKTKYAGEYLTDIASRRPKSATLQLQKTMTDLSRHRAKKRSNVDALDARTLSSTDDTADIAPAAGGAMGHTKRRAPSKIDVGNAAFPLVLCDQDPFKEPLHVPYDGYAQLHLPDLLTGDKQGRIPVAAVLNPQAGRLSIPASWQLVIPPHLFALKGGISLPQASYAIGDVTRDTLVGTVTSNIATFLKIKQGGDIIHLVKVLVPSTGEHEYLSPTSTAKDVDLFNSSSRLLVTTLAPGSLGQHQASSMLSAAKTSPNHAPSHLATVNNIQGGTDSFSGAPSQLSDIDKRGWTKVKKHIQKLNIIPMQMCYNVSRTPFDKPVLCSMLTHSPSTPRCRAHSAGCLITTETTGTCSFCLLMSQVKRIAGLIIFSNSSLTSLWLQMVVMSPMSFYLRIRAVMKARPGIWFTAVGIAVTLHAGTRGGMTCSTALTQTEVLMTSASGANSQWRSAL